MEKIKYPSQYIKITQGYGEGTHVDSFAIDEAGSDAGIDFLVAPFTGTIKKIYLADANEVWLESNDKVLFADGTVDYATIMMCHDNDVSNLKVGQVIKQGERFYEEGTKGFATGNHCHMEIAKGKFTGTGWHQNTAGYWSINNGKKPEECYMIDDSHIILNNRGYNFKHVSEVQEKTEPVQTPTPKYGVGTVVCVNTIWASSNGGQAYKGDWQGTITRVIPGAEHPYLLNDGNIGWTNDEAIDTDPHIPGQNSTPKLYLPASAKSWNVYPLDKQPIDGNESGRLNPSKYGGLTYEIIGWSQTNVAIIDTKYFGRVKIYVAPDTGAVIE